MKIEGNQKELDAMVEFHKGNRVEGLRLQEEFAAEFRKEYKDKDHCPCLKACRYHGNCKECVAIQGAASEESLIRQIPVDISHILGNLITVIFNYQILRKPLKILSL